MPTLIDFISRVVPWPGVGAPGVVNHHWRAKNTQSGNSYWGGRPHTTPQSFADLTRWAVGRPQFVQDIYFCLSLQSQVGKYSRGKPTVARSADNALALKAIWLDIDVKDPPKGYTSQEEALQALDVFLAAAKYPFPTSIVASGGGLHVYWISDRALSVNEWAPYAEALKTAAIQHGLRCDAGLTTDCARILRVPETFNFKTDPPRPVQLLWLADADMDFSVLPQVATAVTATVKKAATNYDLSAFSKPASAFAALSVADDHAADGIKQYEDTPLDPTPILKGCPFFKDAFNTHGKDHGQPLWNLVVLATTFWQNGEVFAHELGNAHPGYSAAETDKMFARKAKERDLKGLGWPSCAAIENEGCKLCAGCAHKGHIKSPLNLATGGNATNVVPFSQSPAVPNDPMMLPNGYIVDPKNGLISQVVELQVDKGRAPITYVPLFKSKISNPWIQGDGARGLNFTVSLDKGRFGPVLIKDENLATVSAMCANLYSQGVLLNTRVETAVREFIVSWKASIQERMEAQPSLPFGWDIDPNGGEIKGFAYGGRLLHKQNVDGTLPPDTPTGIGDANIRRVYTPQGSAQPWIDCMKMIVSQNRPDLELIIATAFAGPLMEFVAKDMVTFAAFGESGAHKSSAIMIGAAVWGHSKLARETHTSTHKGVLKKMGQLMNIPIFWDELTDKKLIGRVFDTMFSGGQGAEGSTLRSDRSSNDRGIWRTSMSINLNESFVDFVADRQKNTEAGVYRVFEYRVEKKEGQLTDAEASNMIQKLEYNYGNIGMEFARFLAADPESIRAAITKHSETWAKRLDASTAERNWVAAVTVTHFAALFANQYILEPAGCPFHTMEMQNVLTDAFLAMRSKLALASNSMDKMYSIRDVVQRWFMSTMENTIWTNRINMGRGKPAAITVVYGPPSNRREPVYSQFGIENHCLRINRPRFIDWLHEHEYNPTNVIRGLQLHYGMTQTEAHLAAGTGMDTQPQRVFHFDITKGHPLEQMLYSKVPPDQKPDYLVEKETEEPATKGTGIVEAAVAQAEKDLNTVRAA